VRCFVTLVVPIALMASVVLAACTADAPAPSSEPPPDDYPDEIDGWKVDPLHGRCTGVVGEPTWARCIGRCEPLDEVACRTAAGCRIAYSDDLRTPAEEHAFRECLPVAPGPAQAAACDTLDAIGCSQREDCTALHAGLFFYAPFIRCEPRI
jgi:hypothetical protein